MAICPDCGVDHELFNDAEICAIAYVSWREMVSELPPVELEAFKKRMREIIQRICDAMQIERLNIGETLHVIDVLTKYHFSMCAKQLRSDPTAKDKWIH